MEPLPADYALGGIALAMAVFGLFFGFSGALAFLMATPAAALAAGFCWPYSAEVSNVVWVRAAGVFVVSLLVFGLVRIVVKKLVNVLLAQPADAIFGLLAGALAGVLLVVAWGRSGLYLEYSNLAREVAAHVR